MSLDMTKTITLSGRTMLHSILENMADEMVANDVSDLTAEFSAGGKGFKLTVSLEEHA